METNNTNPDSAHVNAETLQAAHAVRVHLAADLADIWHANKQGAPVYLDGYENNGKLAEYATRAVVLAIEVLQGYAYGEDLRALSHTAAAAAANLLEFANSIDE